MPTSGTQLFKMTNFGPGYSPINYKFNQDLLKSVSSYLIWAGAAALCALNTYVATKYSDGPGFVWFVLFLFALGPFSVGFAMTYDIIQKESLKKIRIKMIENNDVYQNFLDLQNINVIFPIFGLVTYVLFIPTTYLGYYMGDGLSAAMNVSLVFISMTYTTMLMSSISKISAWVASPSLMTIGLWFTWEMSRLCGETVDVD